MAGFKNRGSVATADRISFSRVLKVSVTLLVVASTAWIYYAYSLLLSPVSIEALAGPQENFYFPVAQLSIATTDTQSALILYGTGRDRNFDTVELKFQILQSKYMVMAQPSDVTARFANNRPYWQSIHTVGQALEDVERQMKDVRLNPGKAFDVAQQLNQLKDPISTLLTSVGDSEVEHRDALYGDFLAKRRVLFVSGLVILVLLIAIGITLIRADVRRRALFRAEREAAESAREAAKAKSAFLGMVGHELRTPLQSITAAIDVLTHRDFPERDAKVIRRLAAAALQLEAQMKDLTDYARLDAGKLALRRESFCPREIINEVVENSTPSAHAKGLRISSIFSGNESTAISDPYRIQQVVSNLVSNAIKYTERGEIVVSTTVRPGPDADWIQISVSDTGAGIPADRVDRMFEPFTQLDQSVERRQEGAGIGLAIVSRLTKLLGGSISVKSAVGEGTEISVSIPLEIPSPAVDAERVEQEQEPVVRIRRVLVVDDHASAREAFTGMLASLGIQSDTAVDATEAVERLSARQYDAVLLDVQMPGKGGVFVAQEVRASNGPNKRVPIICISAYAAELLDASQRALFTDYLMKPVRVDILARALNGLHRRRN